MKPTWFIGFEVLFKTHFGFASASTQRTPTPRTRTRCNSDFAFLVSMGQTSDAEYSRRKMTGSATYWCSRYLAHHTGEFQTPCVTPNLGNCEHERDIEDSFLQYIQYQTDILQPSNSTPNRYS